MERNRLFQFFYLVVLAAFLVSCAVLGIRLMELEEGDSFYRKMGETAGGLSAVSSCPMQPAAADVRPIGSGYFGLDAVTAELSELSFRVSRLSIEYPDIAAWLCIPGTSVDYPVMLGVDNQFYLDHLPDGKNHVLGSLFLDYRSRWNSPHGTGFDGNSPHLIVYGHSGSGGRMFGGLKQYEWQDFYREHKVIIIAAPEAAYVCPIFSVRRVEAEGDAYLLEFEDNDALMNYACRAAEKSLYPIDACLDHMAGILTLSTCTGRGGQRLVVQAILPQE